MRFGSQLRSRAQGTARVSRRRRVASAALGVSMLLGIGGVAMAQPASAAYTACASNYVCGWVHSNYGGAKAPFLFDAPNFTWLSQPQCAHGTWNDCISSAYNNKVNCEARFYLDVVYGGGIPWTYGYHDKSSSLPSGVNDKWSSVRVYCP